MESRIFDKRICVTGGAGFLGRAVCARLAAEGARDIFVPRSSKYDLTRQDDVERLMGDARPEVIIHLAAEVGGIGANQLQPGRFFYANMAMGLNLIETARLHAVEKFVQVGTVCSYPKYCGAPFCEDDLWEGFPEETNAPYGVAKRSLSVMLEAYRIQYGFPGVYLIPANLYGPGDNFDLKTSHVIPALIRRFCEAVDQKQESVCCWGSGLATREFLYVEDAAEAVVRAAARCTDCLPVNIGSGEEVSICELAQVIANLTGFQGTITWNKHQPDGQPRRLIDSSRAVQILEWAPGVSLVDGLQRTIGWWRKEAARTSSKSHANGRGAYESVVNQN